MGGEFGRSFPFIFGREYPYKAVFRRPFAFAVAASGGLSDAIQACFGAHHQRKIHINAGFDERGGDNAAGFAVFQTAIGCRRTADCGVWRALRQSGGTCRQGVWLGRTGCGHGGGCDDGEHLRVFAEFGEQVGIGLRADVLLGGVAQFVKKCG